MADLTPVETIVATFHNALGAGDVAAAVEILEVLATVDLDKAAELYQACTDAVTTVTTLRSAGLTLPPE